MITLTLGFQDTVHHTQQVFRALLNALACPGQLKSIAIQITPPPRLLPACAAACLTLLDLETQVWLQPGFDDSVRTWLTFHTGCRLVASPDAADFAVIWDVAQMPNLDSFHWGTAECPETSTTLLIQTKQLTQGMPIRLKGPGILQERSIDPQLPQQFWQQWQQNSQAYPQGIDVFLFSEHQVMGLPRTSTLMGG